MCTKVFMEMFKLFSPTRRSRSPKPTRLKHSRDARRRSTRRREFFLISYVFSSINTHTFLFVFLFFIIHLVFLLFFCSFFFSFFSLSLHFFLPFSIINPHTHTHTHTHTHHDAMYSNLQQRLMQHVSMDELRHDASVELESARSVVALVVVVVIVV